MLYGFLVVVAFLLCVLFLGKVLRALIHVFCIKSRKAIRKIRSSRFFQRRNTASSRNGTVISQNNDDNARHRNGNEVESSEEYKEDSARTSHPKDSSSKDSKTKSADTSKHSVVSLDWKDHYDSDEKAE